MRYLLRRLGFYLAAFWVAITLNFLLPRLMPGNPFIAMEIKYQSQLQQNPHYLDAVKAMFDFHQNIFQQYVQYLGNLARLDFGVSFSQFPTPVSTIIASALPWSLFLAGTAALLAFVLGTFLGVVVAWWRGGSVDLLVTPATMFTQAFPAFFTALLILYFVGVQAGWFPLSHAWGCNTFGTICTIQPGWNWPYIGSVADHAFMPVLALMLASVGGWLLGMRAVMINTLHEDYVTMAEAKGLTTRRVMFMYAARNALLPQVTSLAITLGYALTSLVLIERVFSYPGLGYQLVASVLANDYPLMQALFFIIAVVMLLANFLADIAYVFLDPRVGVRAGSN
jgi:peptide/nickel transport system permease protein